MEGITFPICTDSLKYVFKTESSGILKFQFYNNSKKYKVNLHSASLCFSSKLPWSVADFADD